MEENAFVNLLAIETAAPKRRIARSAGAIYIALIALIIGCISIGNLLYQRWQIPRHVTQPILYGIIALCAFFLYRRHYICFRYTLTDEVLAIERIGGGDEKTIAAISLLDVKAIHTAKESGRFRGKIIHASLPPRREATWILTKDRERDVIYTISAPAEFVQRFNEAWQAALRAKENA